jgi:hypothetical protein
MEEARSIYKIPHRQVEQMEQTLYSVEAVQQRAQAVSRVHLVVLQAHKQALQDLHLQAVTAVKTMAVAAVVDTGAAVAVPTKQVRQEAAAETLL